MSAFSEPEVKAKSRFWRNWPRVNTRRRVSPIWKPALSMSSFFWLPAVKSRPPAELSPSGKANAPPRLRPVWLLYSGLRRRRLPSKVLSRVTPLGPALKVPGRSLERPSSGRLSLLFAPVFSAWARGAWMAG